MKENVSVVCTLSCNCLSVQPDEDNRQLPAGIYKEELP